MSSLADDETNVMYQNLRRSNFWFGFWCAVLCVFVIPGILAAVAVGMSLVFGEAG